MNDGEDRTPQLGKRTLRKTINRGQGDIRSSCWRGGARGRHSGGIQLSEKPLDNRHGITREKNWTK